MNISNLKSRFPVFKKNPNLVFLDTAASALKVDEMIEATNNCYTNEYANIHRGNYELSSKLTIKFEDARKKVADYLNTSQKNIILPLHILRRSWSKLSYEIQKIRDNSKLAEDDYKSKINIHKSNIKIKNKIKIQKIKKVFKGRKPSVAILREQGINGHKEMADAFMKAGFN